MSLLLKDDIMSKCYISFETLPNQNLYYFFETSAR